MRIERFMNKDGTLDWEFMSNSFRYLFSAVIVIILLGLIAYVHKIVNNSNSSSCSRCGYCR